VRALVGCLLLLALSGASPARSQVADSPAGEAAVVGVGGFVALSVPDIEASIRWYTEVLGLRLASRPADSAQVKVAILEGEGLLVELLQHADAAPAAAEGTAPAQGIFKAGLLVRDFDRVVARLRARGAEIAYGPFPAREGQRANLIVRDNAGNLLQLLAADPVAAGAD
jgi:catechol 2,3-dioxygenase-like lactoylglutathione lyase family enzyme